jgi:hypothetical protein
MMPTAARAVAAVAFAGVAFLGAEVYKPGLTPDTQWGQFSPICAAIGLVCGWMISGARRKPGWLAAGATGMRTSVTVVFWALLLFSLRYEPLIVLLAGGVLAGLLTEWAGRQWN